jgi:hypothetical protein
MQCSSFIAIGKVRATLTSPLKAQHNKWTRFLPTKKAPSCQSQGLLNNGLEQYQNQKAVGRVS